jgi:hypothetical protein
LVCDCVERFRSMIEDRRKEANLRLEEDLPKRLENFAEAMRLGALQLVARYLLRAGVFRASLDLGNPREVSPDEMIEGVKRVVAGRPELVKFLSERREIILNQARYVDPIDVLPKKISRERWRETFGGYLGENLAAAEKMLKQLEVLERRLPVWKSLVRSADVPRIEPVMDYHDSK